MIYVMSDIHGHRRRFDSVMKQINLQPEDTLYILGDVIDRNPDGIRILQQLRAMPNVVMLLGNHEYKLYRKESDVLQGYCQSHAASVFFKDRFIGISTPISDWRIIPSGKGNEVVLYHKNTLGDKKTGPVPGYHLQRVSQNTISGYLEYISDHDLYRNMHPLYPVQSKKNSPPPMKGTKRYRKEQKRAAKKARRQSIAHVLTLIENLDTQARVARSM